MTVTDHRPVSATAIAWVGVFVLAGFALRVAAASSGGLWLDEAWSAVFAHEARPLIGVFADINHDNNHHLNTLWLQLVGLSAPPLVMRGLSILTGTAAIIVAARIGARRSPGAAIAAAALFAFMPILVLYGSEARGYAPLTLAVLLALYTVTGVADRPDRVQPARALAIIAVFGTLAHLTMALAIAVLAAWVWLVRWRAAGVRAATRTTAQLMLPALLTSFTLIAIIVGGAYRHGGFQVGSFEPFAITHVAGGLAELAGLTSGLSPYGPVGVGGLLGVAVTLLICTVLAGRDPLRDRMPLYAMLIVALPLVVIVLHVGNSQFARYYLLSALGLLLLVSDRIGALLFAPGRARWVGRALLAAWLVGSIGQIATIMTNQRGHMDRAVAVMQAAAPRGTQVLIESQRASAVLEVAAAQRQFPLQIETGQCGAPFWYVERERPAPIESERTRCGHRWLPIASADAIGPSGQSWTLYADRGLPIRVAAVTGPLPTRF